MNPETIEEFTAALSRASYCYADDSGSDWRYGSGHVADAAQIAIDAGWTPDQIEAAYRLKPQLVALDEVQRAVSRLRRVAA